MVISSGVLTFQPLGTSILLGYNGSGKSTFLKTLCRLIPPVHGTIPIFGSGLLPEDMDFAGDIKPLSIFGAVCPGYPHSETVLDCLEIPRGKLFRQLSKGNKQKLRIAVTEALALTLNRDILCLDEPLSGLDLRVRDIIVRAWEGGGTLGAAWGDFRGHRIISQHSGGTVSNAVQTLVAWDGKLHVNGGVRTCENWPRELGYCT